MADDQNKVVDDTTNQEGQIDEVKSSMGDPSMAADPIDTKVKPRKADKKTSDEGSKVVAKEDVDVVEETEVVTEIDPTVASIFEGLDLSEEFKNKVQLVFEAAINEQVTQRVAVIEEELTEKLESEMQESIEDKVEEIVENLDKYLDYVVEEWMSENEIAIETGIKVEMAESLMQGLKELFEEHNIDVDDDTINVVAGLEEQLEDVQETANELINENIQLSAEITRMKAERVFEEMTEDLTVSQRERLKILSEKLDRDDLEEYSGNLQTIKESFFTETAVKKDAVEEEEIITEEDNVKRPVSDYSSVNALVEALNARKMK